MKCVSMQFYILHRKLGLVLREFEEALKELLLILKNSFLHCSLTIEWEKFNFGENMCTVDKPNIQS